jgi:4-hydroxysphinganine ceramide fatty acyl 2-hydroxylase
MRYATEFLTDRRVLFLLSVSTVSLIGTLTFPLHTMDWLALAGGVVVWYFTEYIVHRFILHGILAKVMPKAYDGHARHHSHPEELKYLLTPNHYNIPGYVFFAVIAYLVTRHFDTTSAFLLTLSLSQIYYEWSHFVSHRPIVPLSPWGKWMKKFHLLHHFKNEHYWFGVTNATLDVLVGSDPEPSKVPSYSTADKKRYGEHGADGDGVFQEPSHDIP